MASSAWLDLLLGDPGSVGDPATLARAVLLACLAVWTVSFLLHGLDPGHLMGSFMHLVHLPFHEAGHVLSMPFGRFVMVLGGSLFQILVPLLCGGVFLLRNRDPYAASVTAWWTGQSFMDLAPYVADARSLTLPLLGGRTGAEVEGHDWEYLLSVVGLSAQDVLLGRAAFVLGAGLMLAALAWGGLVTWRQRRAAAS